MSRTTHATRAHAQPHNSLRKEAENSLTDAIEHLTYWRRQAICRTSSAAVMQAKALTEAWQTTVDARRARLDKLS